MFSQLVKLNAEDVVYMKYAWLHLHNEMHMITSTRYSKSIIIHYLHNQEDIINCSTKPRGKLNLYDLQMCQLCECVERITGKTATWLIGLCLQQILTEEPYRVTTVQT